MKQQALLPCDTWAEKLAAIHSDDLTIEERAALAQHVQTCASCAAALADYRRMDAAILALPPVEPLLALPLALQQAFGKEEADGALPPTRSTSLPRPQPRMRRWVRLTGGIAAVLVVAMLIGGFAFLFSSYHTLVGGAGAGRVIYVASRDNDGTVYAIRPSDGAVYWQYGIGQKLSGDLVASSNGVYASAGAHVFALRKSDGALRWTSPAIPGGAFPPMLVDENAVYLSSPDSLYALSVQDGHILWSRTGQSCNDSCVAAIMAAADGVAYAYQGEQGGLYALRASDGHVIWYDPAYHFDSAQFAVSDGKVFVPDEKKGLLYELSASDGKLLHTFSIFRRDQPMELLAADGVVYIDNVDSLYAIRASDGTLLWQKQYNDIVLGLSAADNGGLYFAATTETVGSIEIVSSSGSPVAGATPSVSSATSTDAYAINASDGSLRWHWQPSNHTGGASRVLSIDGNVYLTVGGSLYALSASDGKQVWVALQVSDLSAPVTG